MKKIVSLTLCLALVMALASSAFAIAIGGISMADKKVTAFVELVDAIGDPVTLADKEAIEAAEDYTLMIVVESSGLNFYNRYIADGMRANADAQAAYQRLVAAREAYDALVAGGSAEQPTTPPADEPTETPTEAPTKPGIQIPTEAPTEAPTKPGIQIPTEAPTQAPTQAPTETPVDPAGDNTFMVMALVMLSMTALVVLVSKKRVF